MPKLSLPYQLDLRSIRRELGLSQSDFARLLAVSPRTVQSCEQGWRVPSPTLEKAAIMVLMAHRNRHRFASKTCWEATDCPQRIRKNCMAYWSRQGHLCWFLSGTLCKGIQLQNWVEKLTVCRECKFFHMLLRGDLPVKRKGRGVVLHGE